MNESMRVVLQLCQLVCWIHVGVIDWLLPVTQEYETTLSWQSLISSLESCRRGRPTTALALLLFWHQLCSGLARHVHTQKVTRELGHVATIKVNRCATYTCSADFKLLKQS